MKSSDHSPAAELRAIFEQALAASKPAPLLDAACQVLEHPSYLVVGLGKAAATMATAVLRAFDRRGIECAGGLVVAPEPVEVGLEALVGSHPVPDHSSEVAGRRLMEVVADSEHPVLALISGGGSALAAVPAPGLTLDEKRAATSAVMAAGASIHELNTVRKHLSAIKGGQLAALARAPVTTLAMSDVVGDDLAAIASGPTVADPTTFAEAIHVCRTRGVYQALPEAVVQHLEAGTKGGRPETPKVVSGSAQVVVPLRHAADQAAAVANAQGYLAVVEALPSKPVESLAADLVQRFKGLKSGEIWVGFGEPELEVPAAAGTGGRAHHLAMLLARELRGAPVAALVAGTDGIDGVAPSAGAVITGESWQAMVEKADPSGALAGFDTYPALAAVGATLEIGRTGINHADLVIAARTS